MLPGLVRPRLNVFLVEPDEHVRKLAAHRFCFPATRPTAKGSPPSPRTNSPSPGPHHQRSQRPDDAFRRPGATVRSSVRSCRPPHHLFRMWSTARCGCAGRDFLCKVHSSLVKRGELRARPAVAPTSPVPTFRCKRFVVNHQTNARGMMRIASRRPPVTGMAGISPGPVEVLKLLKVATGVASEPGVQEICCALLMPRMDTTGSCNRTRPAI